MVLLLSHCIILTAHPYIKHNCSQFDSDIVLFSVSLFCRSLSHKHVVQVQSTASTLTIQCRLCTFSRSMIPRDSFNTSPTITLSLPLLLPNFSTLPTYSFPMKPFLPFLPVYVLTQVCVGSDADGGHQ